MYISAFRGRLGRRGRRTTSLPYGTLTDDEIRSIPLPTLQTLVYLLLWVTGRAIEVCRECLRVWGIREWTIESTVGKYGALPNRGLDRRPRSQRGFGEEGSDKVQTRLIIMRGILILCKLVSDILAWKSRTFEQATICLVLQIVELVERLKRSLELSDDGPINTKPSFRRLQNIERYQERQCHESSRSPHPNVLRLPSSSPLRILIFTPLESHLTSLSLILSLIFSLDAARPYAYPLQTLLERPFLERFRYENHIQSLEEDKHGGRKHHRPRLLSCTFVAVGFSQERGEGQF
ncbi:hypothetical protein FB446DRAFT_705919 [Lentinula raphanica]|nr:hypothetical protein FB446DRAFT_705919 [Lentinula raphanica]